MIGGGIFLHLVPQKANAIAMPTPTPIPMPTPMLCIAAPQSYANACPNTNAGTNADRKRLGE
jgi:hypothetical protein